MGIYRITIEGLGQHHNPSAPSDPTSAAQQTDPNWRDAEKMAKRLVESMRACGHTIRVAKFEKIPDWDGVAYDSEEL